MDVIRLRLKTTAAVIHQWFQKRFKPPHRDGVQCVRNHLKNIHQDKANVPSLQTAIERDSPNFVKEVHAVCTVMSTHSVYQSPDVISDFWGKLFYIVISNCFLYPEMFTIGHGKSWALEKSIDVFVNSILEFGARALTLPSGLTADDLHDLEYGAFDTETDVSVHSSVSQRVKRVTL